MPLACSRRHLGSEPMHRAWQFSQVFLGCIFKERPAQMDMEKPPAWFHWLPMRLHSNMVLRCFEVLPEKTIRHSKATYFTQTPTGPPISPRFPRKTRMTKRCWCLGLRKRALTFPNPNPQNATGVHVGIWGVRNPCTGHDNSVSCF